MRITGSALQIAHEIEKAPKALEELRRLSFADIGREIRRLKHLRAEAHRLNESAFRSALALAETKAPALIEHNAMMSISEISYHRELIEEESRLVRQDIFTILEERLQLCHTELGRRNAIRKHESA